MDANLSLPVKSQAQVKLDLCSSRTWLVAVIGLAVLLRIVAALVLGDTATPVSGAYDQVSYDMLAQRVLTGHGFSFPTAWYPFTAPDEQTAHWSFLYTLYLAGVYAIFGPHTLTARIIQVILSGLQCWLIYRIAYRITRSPVGNGERLGREWVGVAAAALTAVYAYFIFFNAALMTQTFYILALLWSIDIALDLAGNDSISTLHSPISKWLFLGLALGIAALMRQTILIFAPFLFAYIWWARRNPQFATRNSRSSLLTAHWSSRSIRVGLLTGILLSLVITAALILPWTIRNYFVYNDFLLLNSNGGFWLYSSNHPNQGTTFDGNYVAPIPDDLKGLNEAALDRALMREGIGFVIADPARFALLTWSRVGAYFWIAPTEGSLLIANLSRLFSFGLYFPLMLYGLWLSRKHWRAGLLLYLYVAFETTFCLFSWAAPRYRLPSDAMMMVFAGLAGVTLVERVGVAKVLAAKFQIKNLNSKV